MTLKITSLSSKNLYSSFYTIINLKSKFLSKKIDLLTVSIKSNDLQFLVI